MAKPDVSVVVGLQLIDGSDVSASLSLVAVDSGGSSLSLVESVGSAGRLLSCPDESAADNRVPIREAIGGSASGLRNNALGGSCPSMVKFRRNCCVASSLDKVRVQIVTLDAPWRDSSAAVTDRCSVQPNVSAHGLHRMLSAAFSDVLSLLLGENWLLFGSCICGVPLLPGSCIGGPSRLIGACAGTRSSQFDGASGELRSLMSNGFV